ncbi:MAG: peptidoglycan-binding protein [Lachnospiraceae bacterium]|nr:peptidoglycan-binding protein [Lachnospiraceae bacterium]
MAIIIGSARIDENGKISCGAAGDQKQISSANDTVGEVSMQNFYIHTKGWYVLRPKDATIANKIAENMKTACNNTNIGYDQSNRLGVIIYGVNTKVKTECDCSSLVRQCIKEASGKDPGNFTTANEKSMLEASGLFEPAISYSSSTTLYTGDVLVTKSRGHTAVVVNGAARSSDSAISSNVSSDPGTASASKLKVSSTVKSIQTWLNTYYKTGLVVDGVYGTKTKAALVKAWQTEVGGLTVDGIFGTRSKATASSHNIKKGSAGILVTIWQAYLVCRGYNPNGIDGKFGNGCHTATAAFQKANGLTQDGIVGANTYYKAFA